MPKSANKTQLPQLADLADMAASQKAGVFRRPDPLTCQNPPKGEFTSKGPAYETASTRIVRKPRGMRRIDRDGQKNHLAHMAALANMAD